ncbi:MAG: cobalamin-dependent protein [Thermoleophilia bacterium]
MARPDYLLVAAMARLDEERVLFLVERGLAQGAAPTELLARAREGLDRVGELYAAGRYFLADLLMAAHIFRQVLDLLFDVAPVEPDPSLPPVVFGTVQGDIHEIGKNITIAFMRYSGLRIIDLGGNVPPQRFVEEVQRSRAPIICLSGLMTTCYGSMRKTVAALGKAGLRGSTTVIIGGHVSESIRRHVGADYWVDDYLQGVEICRRLLTEKRRPESPLAAES